MIPAFFSGHFIFAVNFTARRHSRDLMRNRPYEILQFSAVIFAISKTILLCTEVRKIRAIMELPVMR